MTQKLEGTPAVAAARMSTDKASLSSDRSNAMRLATVNSTRSPFRILELQRSSRRARICRRS